MSIQREFFLRTKPEKEMVLMSIFKNLKKRTNTCKMSSCNAFLKEKGNFLSHDSMRLGSKFFIIGAIISR